MLNLLSFFILTLAQAQTTDQKAEKFFAWLAESEKTFTDCRIQKKGDVITMCDNTQVSFNELKNLFSKNTAELISELKKKKIRVEIVCDTVLIGAPCIPESTNSTFKKVSGMHGLYVPGENKIYIRSTATPGVIIHEYLHSLQTKNKEKINGRVYKTEKNELRKEIETNLDDLMAEIKSLEQKKEKTKLNTKVTEFVKLNSHMLAFSKWQDLIDERSIFQLFISQQKELGVGDVDLKLAKKNMKFICERRDLKLSDSDCKDL